MRTRKVTTIDVDGLEVELDMSPEYFEPETIQPTPTTLVVGYLMQDEDCENPMTSHDCEGKLYTSPGPYGGGCITDDRSAPGYLGLSSFGSSYHDYEPDLERDGIFERVAEKVTAQIKADPELSAWMVAHVMESGSAEKLIDDLVSDQLEGSRYTKFDWSDENDQEMISRLGPYESLAKEAWEELYKEGKIGDYLAVPVRWCSSNHGPGTASAYTTTLDNANAVWVPDKCALENIKVSATPKGVSVEQDRSVVPMPSPNPYLVKAEGEIVFRAGSYGEAMKYVKDNFPPLTHADRIAAADKYASDVLGEYVKWCNGECYGIVTETFVLEGDQYVKVGETESCWGFIGEEWAEEALKEQMGWCVEKLKEREAA